MRAMRLDAPAPARAWLAYGGIVILLAHWLLSGYPATSDADNFWQVDPFDPYPEPWGGPNAFVYSPAFAQLISPLTLLPWEIFYKVWQAIGLAALAYLLTPAGAAVALLLPFIRSDIDGGQIHLWLAVVMVSLHPASWALGLLTKVTPGVGLLWYVGRREWRQVWSALLITALIVAVSMFIDYGAWMAWIRLLIESSTMRMSNMAFSEWPALFRLPIAAGFTVMAAWRNRPAALPLIICFALPAIWPASLALVAAVPRLLYRHSDRTLAR